jgi:hypothetical protein
MRWNKLGMIVGLAGTIMSTTTYAVPENSLLASAQPVTHIGKVDPYQWNNQQLLVVYTRDKTVEINRQTHRHTTLRETLEQFLLRTGFTHLYTGPTIPRWLPPGAKIVGFDSGVRVPPVNQEAWVVTWPVSGSATEAGHPLPGRTPTPEARFGVWITGPDGTKERLLGVAPLSRQEFETLPRNENPMLLPNPSEVSFVYRGVLYVMPVSAKLATVENRAKPTGLKKSQ